MLTIHHNSQGVPSLRDSLSTELRIAVAGALPSPCCPATQSHSQDGETSSNPHSISNHLLPLPQSQPRRPNQQLLPQVSPNHIALARRSANQLLRCRVASCSCSNQTARAVSPRTPVTTRTAGSHLFFFCRRRRRGCGRPPRGRRLFSREGSRRRTAGRSPTARPGTSPSKPSPRRACPTMSCSPAGPSSRARRPPPRPSRPRVSTRPRRRAHRAGSGPWRRRWGPACRAPASCAASRPAAAAGVRGSGALTKASPSRLNTAHGQHPSAMASASVSATHDRAVQSAWSTTGTVAGPPPSPCPSWWSNRPPRLADISPRRPPAAVSPPSCLCCNFCLSMAWRRNDS
jgi:hypothetical protein